MSKTELVEFIANKDGLTKADVLSKENGGLNRKMLSEMAINDATGFANLCDIAKKALEK